MSALTIVAAPLTARSGVYRTVHELVAAARSRGLDWHGLIGIDPRAGSPSSSVDGITEFVLPANGLRGVVQLRTLLLEKLPADSTTISMIPQSDMALASTRRHWIAYLRGQPWPSRGESSTIKRLLWRALELCALKRATSVWATTPVLASALPVALPVRIVAPGIAAVARVEMVAAPIGQIVWAARFDIDKDPHTFVRAVSAAGGRGVMYGSGGLKSEVAESLPENVEIGGWVAADQLWDNAWLYVGTSRREAFGRSAVEAAMAGLPIIITRSFGAAPLLFTDPSIAADYVFEPGDADALARAIRKLEDPAELKRLRAHVSENARALTIEASLDAILAAVADADGSASVP